MANEAATLKDLLADKNHSGFKLGIAYFAELAHGLMGAFPAIETESREPVITLDLELLRKICATLTSRRFAFRMQLVYFNPETNVAYSILGTDEAALQKATPLHLLNKENINLKQGTFEWAPGLAGGSIAKVEFERLLRAAVSQ